MIINNLFDIDFSRWNILLLFFVPAAINLGIFVYTSLFLPRSSTNYSFKVFVFLVIMWQISTGFMMMSNSAQTAALWCRVLWMFFLFVVPFGMVFTICFLRLERKISNTFLFLTQFLPPIIFVFFIMGGLSKFSFVRSSQWYWIANPQTGIINSLMYAWVCLEAFLVLGFLWYNFVLSRKDSVRKKQTLLLTIGFAVPIVWGILAEAVFPLVFKTNDIPATGPLFTTFSIFALIAIKRYKLLVFSPKHQWNQIVEAMNEGILIVDNKERIMYANSMFCNQMGYEFEEIRGKIAHELLTENWKKQPEMVEAIEDRKNRKSGQYEVELVTKTGSKIWVQISGSPYLDSKGKVIGSIAIQTSINERKKAENEIIKLNEDLEEKVFNRTIDLAKANVQLEKEARLLTHASNVIEQKNRDITDSLNYAKLIQKTVIRRKATLQKLLPESFVVNLPLNIVSGDFVSVSEKDDKIFLALADCTGHGIPGAMVSMIGFTLVNEIVNNKCETNPPVILEQLNKAFDGLITETDGIRDGMDIAFCAIDKTKMELNFAGAHRPLYFIRDNKLTEIKGDNLSIGGHSGRKSEFKNTCIQLQKDDKLYMFSDGYTDQFGGIKGKKFSTKRFKEMLLAIQNLNMEEQRNYLKKIIQDWRGNLEQVDDICVIGVSI